MPRNTVARYIAFDVETPNARNNRISSIGISIIENGVIVNRFTSLVNPETHFDPFNIQLTGISPEKVQYAPAFPGLWQRIEPLMRSGILVAHNAVFDLGVLDKCLRDYGIPWKKSIRYLCTVQIGRQILPGISHKLNVLCDYYGITLNHHQADSDSDACAKILLRYMEDGTDVRRFLRTYVFSTADASHPSQPTAEQVSPVTENLSPVPPAISEDTAAVLADTTAKPAATDAAVSGPSLSEPFRPFPENTPSAPSAVPVQSVGPEKKSEAKKLLSQIYGYHSFRPGQEKAIFGLLSGQDALCVMPTGSGKSLCYQLPALLFPGVTLVISPLISLMNDQVSAMKNRGIPAICLNSSLALGEYSRLAFQASRGGCKIICVAPERLQSQSFIDMCLRLDISFVAVDEAHCISQWGQDFRPSYLKIPDFIHILPRRPVVGAFTATATPRVRKDILENLQLQNPVSVSTGFDRPNLSFSVYDPSNKDQTLLGLLRDRFRQSGIVYCSTRKAVESVCDLLVQEGFPATRYHAGLEHAERVANQEDFLYDRKRVMVATNAFGMGIDKANVSYVIHYNMPMSLEAYYQEAGRAGRDSCDADCILLYSGQDVITARWLIEHSEPNPDLSPEKQAEVQAHELDRLKWMTFYARSQKCFRGEILRYFGENAPTQCGNCSNCVPNCEHIDITTDAQMILSCVARAGQTLQDDAIAAILLGNVPEDAPKDLEAEKLTTFGLMKERRQDQVLEEIRTLCDQGYLDRSPENSWILILNDRSRDVLFRNRRVTMRLDAHRKPGSAGSDALFQALQRLRYEISAREHIAATHLFSEWTLRSICVDLPRNKTDLARVEGMGLYKANRYGDEILRLVERFSPASKTKSDRSKKKTRSTTAAVPSYREQVITEGKTDAYQSWTEEEEQQLIREYRSKTTLENISAIHHRTRGAILSRLRKLDLI